MVIPFGRVQRSVTETDRIGERAHHVEPVGHRGDALVIEREAVEKGRCGAGRLGFGQVLGVGGENGGLARADRRRHRRERGVLLRRGCERKRARGGLRAAADVMHQAGNVGALDRLEWSRHDEIHVLSISPYHVRGNPARRHECPDSEVRKPRGNL